MGGQLSLNKGAGVALGSLYRSSSEGKVLVTGTVDPKEELAKVDSAIEAQEKLWGVLPDEQVEDYLQLLQQKRQLLVSQLKGGGAIARGKSAVVAGEDGIAVGGNVVIAERGASVVIVEKPIAMTQVDRELAIGHYLNHIISRNRYLQLQDIRSGGRLVNIELDHIYIRLRTTQRRASGGGRRIPAQ